MKPKRNVNRMKLRRPQFNVLLSENLHKKFRIICTIQERPMQEVVAELVESWIDQQTKNGRLSFNSADGQHVGQYSFSW